MAAQHDELQPFFFHSHLLDIVTYQRDDHLLLRFQCKQGCIIMTALNLSYSILISQTNMYNDNMMTVSSIVVLIIPCEEGRGHRENEPTRCYRTTPNLSYSILISQTHDANVLQWVSASLYASRQDGSSQVNQKEFLVSNPGSQKRQEYGRSIRGTLIGVEEGGGGAIKIAQHRSTRKRVIVPAWSIITQIQEYPIYLGQFQTGFNGGGSGSDPLCRTFSQNYPTTKCFYMHRDNNYGSSQVNRKEIPWFLVCYNSGSRT